MAAELEAVCLQVYPRLVAGFRALGLDREDAEDTAQDALVKLSDQWSKRRPEHPLAWAYAVGRNGAITRWRRRSVETRILGLLGRSPQVSEDAFEDGVVTGQVVRDAVRGLPRRQREAIIHRFFLGLDVAATAAAMGCAAGTVTALTHQALARLRSEPALEHPTTEVARP